MIHILQLSTSLCRVVVILNVQRIGNKDTNKQKKKSVELFCHWVTLQRGIHNQEQHKMMSMIDNQRTLWHITYSLQCIIEITSPSTTNAEYNNIPLALSGTSSAPERTKWNESRLMLKAEVYMTVMA